MRNPASVRFVHEARSQTDYRGLPVTSLINIGNEFAFHGAPGPGIAPLTLAVDRAVDLAEHSQARWILGVCYSSIGKFVESWDVLAPLLAGPPTPTHWASLAHTTIASTLRQQNEHTAAQRHDEQALLISDEVTAFDAYVGLAADSVGQFDVSDARRNWELARSVARIEWRQQVRLAWVEAEISLMENRADRALQVSLTAARVADRSQAPRHRAKSLLFAGVSALGVGDRGQAIQLLEESVLICDELELNPIAEPARKMLARAHCA